MSHQGHPKQKACAPGLWAVCHAPASDARAGRGSCISDNNFPYAPQSQAPSIRLSEQDLQALRLISLKGYRYLTCRHLGGLVFGSEDLCQTRIKELARGGLVSRLHLPITTHCRQGQAIYTLGRKGAFVLAETDEEKPRHLYRKVTPPSYLFLRHALAISDFRYAVEMALRKRQNAKLLFWRSEWELRKLHGKRMRVKLPAVVNGLLRLVPDGMFGLELNGERLYYLLEIDLGTMSTKDIRRKFWAYIEFYREGLHKRLFQPPHFRVVFLTTTEARMRRMMEALRDIGRCPNMFFFTVHSQRGTDARRGNFQLLAERILSSIWRRCRDDELHSLLA